MSSQNALSRRAMLVLGMHRSGTSALTRTLNLLGVDLGSGLSGPGEDNRLGFWEHTRVVAIHEMLLGDLGSSWHDTRALPENWMSTEAARKAKLAITELVESDFSESPLWAVKDPRLCRLVPLWKEVLDGLGVAISVVFSVRHPGEVARKQRRLVATFTRAKSRAHWRPETVFCRGAAGCDGSSISLRQSMPPADYQGPWSLMKTCWRIGGAH